MKGKNLTIKILWNENARPDKRIIAVDYDTEIELNCIKNRIVADFRNKPMDIGVHKGKIPYKVIMED